MKSIAWSLALLSALLFAAACGDDSGDDGADGGSGDGGEHEGHDELPEVDCDAEEIPGFDEVRAFAKCTDCHSSELSGGDRNNAPIGYDWDEYESAQEHAEHIAHVVASGDMPPEGSGITLTASEEDELYLWALCGAPD
jgi:uncharacterized membrane protein